MKHPGIPILLAVLALVLLLSGWQPVAASPALPVTPKIMPFGDSITSSVGDGKCSLNGGPVLSAQASYRYWLYNDLHNALIPFEFIGTQTTNWCGQPLHAGQFDQHNEGHSGYQAADFLNPGDQYYIDKLLNANSNGNVPDIVLMHLGTVDLSKGRTKPEIIADLGSLIDHFRAKNPKVIVLVAQIIPCATTTYYKTPQDRSFCSKIPDLNSAIPALVAQKNSPISPVDVVDQYDGFDATQGVDTYDGLHPQASGEKKMAAKWLAAIQKWYLYKPHREFLPFLTK